MPIAACLMLLVAPADDVLSADEAVDFDFEVHDVDNNGYLTELEWEEAPWVTVSFVAADTDNNGRIDREEALEVARLGL